jgi:hypothetical protein
MCKADHKRVIAGQSREGILVFCAVGGARSHFSNAINTGHGICTTAGAYFIQDGQLVHVPALLLPYRRPLCAVSCRPYRLTPPIPLLLAAQPPSTSRLISSLQIPSTHLCSTSITAPSPPPSRISLRRIRLAVISQAPFHVHALLLPPVLPDLAQPTIHSGITALSAVALGVHARASVQVLLHRPPFHPPLRRLAT